MHRFSAAYFGEAFGRYWYRGFLHNLITFAEANDRGRRNQTSKQYPTTDAFLSRT